LHLSASERVRARLRASDCISIDLHYPPHQVNAQGLMAVDCA
jgi:hypothetical protein